MNSLHLILNSAYRAGASLDRLGLAALIAAFPAMNHEILQAFGRGRRFARP